MQSILIFILGFFIGGAAVLIFFLLRKKDMNQMAASFISAAESDKEKERELIIDYLKSSFTSLSFDALSKSTEQFLKLANETLSKQLQSGNLTLNEKKELIDQTLKTMKDELTNVQDLMKTIEKDRVQKFSTLAEQIQQQSRVTKELSDSTSQLKNALASSKTRGQWGERMAEDILRLSGLKEGINYLKQKALQSTSTRPDYTFLLPNDLSVNMDVKFPLDNYSAYLNTENDTEKKKYKEIFLRDIRARIKEVTSRDYINPDENTVDYVLVFIPNEQIYSFVMEHDSNLIDESLKQKVILCSPITLYAILAIIRQAVDNFSLEKKASLIISLMNTFHKQWEKFIESLEKMGRRIDDAKKEYESLMSTRRNQLEKPLVQIDELRQESGIKMESLLLPSSPQENDEKED